jgi:predicted nucleic acid-binding protein
MLSISLLAITEGVLERASDLDPPALRTLDAIHLASALRIGADLEAFVTYDRRQSAAAEAMGLRVTAPH